MNRRFFMQGMTALGAAGSLLMPSAAQAQEQLRLFWWGTPDRAARTLKVVKLFEDANPDSRFLGEASAGDYFSKLTTMISGGNAPDVFALEPGRFAEYSRRGVCLPLNDFIGSTIRIDDLVPDVLDLGKLDGDVTGMPIALNALAMICDPAIYQETGIKAPGPDTTWDDFATQCVELTKAVGKRNVWAVGSAAKYLYAFQVFVKQRGKQLYNEDASLGFDATDAEDWYGYWESLTKRGGCSSAEFQSMDSTMVDTSPLANGNAFVALGYSNQLSAFQSVSGKTLSVTEMPVQEKGGASGLFYRPSQYWCIARNCKNPEIAARFIDFWVNDANAARVLEAERGVPINVKVRAEVADQLDPASQATVTYIDSIADRVSSYPPQVPLGVSEFDERAFRPLADRVAFGQITPTEAAADLMKAGARMLRI